MSITKLGISLDISRQWIFFYTSVIIFILFFSYIFSSRFYKTDKENAKTCEKSGKKYITKIGDFYKKKN